MSWERLNSGLILTALWDGILITFYQWGNQGTRVQLFPSSSWWSSDSSPDPDMQVHAVHHRLQWKKIWKGSYQLFQKQTCSVPGRWSPAHIPWHWSWFSSLLAEMLKYMAQMVKNLPTMWETQVQSVGWENPLEEGMATHSSILAWRIPWTKEAGGDPFHGVTKSWTWLKD